MWEHIGTHRHFKPGGCRLASGIGDRWSALDRALSRKRSVLEREMIERGFDEATNMSYYKLLFENET